jgi:hypothetical protein
MKKLSLLLLLLATTACHKNTNDEITKYHEDGRAKPIVAIIPVIDSTTYEGLWSLSDEFTTTISNQVAQTNNIYLQSMEYLKSITNNDNPFQEDLSWVKETYTSNEFVAFVELVEHENVPTTKNVAKSSSNLNMAIRIRIIDLRNIQPKVILQEYVSDSYYISKNIIPTDYKTSGWGTNDYNLSPMGIAHNQLAKKVAQRISDYILLAKSR